MAPEARPVGAVMRPDTLRALSAGAGFTAVEVPPIAHPSAQPFWRFYRMR